MNPHKAAVSAPARNQKELRRRNKEKCVDCKLPMCFDSTANRAKKKLGVASVPVIEPESQE